MTTYRVIGLMSGTSLDGLDIAFCEFKKKKNWSFKIIKAGTFPYPLALQKKLAGAMQLNTSSILELDRVYGTYLGQQVSEFIKKNKIKPQFIASHGHTVFHQPHKGFTLQIGHGATIAAACKLPVINDFRSTDIAHGGQGAPLVPIGDRHLFAEYDFCLNLGGIANISLEKNKKRVAFDICPANIGFNYFSQLLGYTYDKGGKLAAKGQVNASLLKKLNALNYYKLTGPRSLGREWIDHYFLPVVIKHNCNTYDKLRTLVEHAALQIVKSLGKNSRGKKLLITGGGVYHQLLINRIKELSSVKVVIPSNTIIEFKEAMIFAFLGVLRMRNENNALASVTGANKDNCGGSIYLP